MTCVAARDTTSFHVRCRVLQGAAGCCRVLHGVAGVQGVSVRINMCCSTRPDILANALQGVAGCCKVLQGVAASCSMCSTGVAVCDMTTYPGVTQLVRMYTT